MGTWDGQWNLGFGDCAPADLIRTGGFPNTRGLPRTGALASLPASASAGLSADRTGLVDWWTGSPALESSVLRNGTHWKSSLLPHFWHYRRLHLLHLDPLQRLSDLHPSSSHPLVASHHRCPFYARVQQSAKGLFLLFSVSSGRFICGLPPDHPNGRLLPSPTSSTLQTPLDPSTNSLLPTKPHNKHTAHQLPPITCCLVPIIQQNPLPCPRYRHDLPDNTRIWTQLCLQSPFETTTRKQKQALTSSRYTSNT